MRKITRGHNYCKIKNKKWSAVFYFSSSNKSFNIYKNLVKNLVSRAMPEEGKSQKW